MGVVKGHVVQPAEDSSEVRGEEGNGKNVEQEKKPFTHPLIHSLTHSLTNYLTS